MYAGVDGPAGSELHRAADPAKDQSYFLFATTAEQLAFLRFPLGGLTKPETRALAERFDLPVAAKPDSQDICFVPNGGYASVVEKLRPGAVEPGEIVDLDGRALGRHEGIIHFTIGQRRGIGIGGGDPLYVIRLEPESHRVVVGPKSALARDRVRIRALNWLETEPLAKAGEGPGRRAQVKLRSAQPASSGAAFTMPGGGAEIVLDDPQHGIAPGQAAVLYDGDRVLGGGWITGAALGRAA